MRAMILRQPGTRLEEVDPASIAAGARGRYGSRCGPAPCAAPTCTWWTEISPIPSCPSSPGMKSWEKWSSRVPASAGTPSATGSASRGWVGPAGGAPTAGRAARTSATEARFTGYTLNGGYAEEVVAYERYCFPMPQEYSGRGGGSPPVRRTHRVPVAGPWPVRDAIWAFTASERRPISSPRWPIIRAGVFTPLPVPAIGRPRISPSPWGRSGPGARNGCRPNRWTPPLSLHRWVRWSRWRWKP